MMVYLDHNATTRPRDEAVAAMVALLSETGNAASVHAAGRRARMLLRNARTAVARAIDLPDGGEIVFTSGGTEANLLALAGTEAVHRLYAATEHDSVRAQADPGEALPVRRDGLLDLDWLASRLAALQVPVLVSVMAANNETGVIQNVTATAEIVHRAGGLLHCDAIQAVGKIPFSMAATGADLVTLSAHKLGGPQGVGALAVRPGLALRPVQRGGGQERGARAGTENLPGIAGFAVAIGLAVRELARFGDLAGPRDLMERRLLAVRPDAVVAGAAVPRLPNTSCIALPGLAAETQVMALDLDGICVSAGAACSSGKVRASHVLEAMGYGADIAGSAIRISLGRDTDQGAIERLVAGWTRLAVRAAARGAA